MSAVGDFREPWAVGVIAFVEPKNLLKIRLEDQVRQVTDALFTLASFDDFRSGKPRGWQPKTARRGAARSAQWTDAAARSRDLRAHLRLSRRPL